MYDEIHAKDLGYKVLNEQVRAAGKELSIDECLGQRFLGAGLSNKELYIHGVPGNALGAYLGGANITVYGNAQDAVGDTMNNGTITIHGNIGDAAGYAMRGGAIYVKGNAGYRAGIHMKEYKEKKPVIVIGGRAGSFLAEYQAGGLIIVLGLHTDGKRIVGRFPCTGMHGGKMVLRGSADGIDFPAQTTLRSANADDLQELRPYLTRFCEAFGYSAKELCGDEYTVITPDSKNPYRQMYVAN